MQLGSHVAVVVVQASSCSSDSSHSPGTSVCCRCDPKKTKKKIFFKLNFIGVKLIYNVVLASGVQQSELVIHKNISIIFSHVG